MFSSKSKKSGDKISLTKEKVPSTSGACTKMMASEIDMRTEPSKSHKGKSVAEKLDTILNTGSVVGPTGSSRPTTSFGTAYKKHDHEKFEKKFGSASGVKAADVLYLMDCTGSMSSWIKICKEKVSQIGGLIRETNPGIKLRQAFIGYRDYKDEGAVMSVDFVQESDLVQFEEFMSPIQARGGGDEAEDIAPALKAATGLSWKSKTKLVLHFADAPCHGTYYHDIPSDDYPDGSPTHLDPGSQLEILSNFKIDYYFVKVGGGSNTEKMVSIFQEIYKKSKKAIFQVHDASDDPAKFIPVVKTSITKSISNS